MKPKIIIHLSDEWGNKEYFQNLYQYTNLLLRQYKHNYYDRNNIKYIDLYQEMKNYGDPLSFFPAKIMRHFSAEGHKKLSKILIKNLN